MSLHGAVSAFLADAFIPSEVKAARAEKYGAAPSKPHVEFPALAMHARHVEDGPHTAFCFFVVLRLKTQTHARMGKSDAVVGRHSYIVVGQSRVDDAFDVQQTDKELVAAFVSAVFLHVFSPFSGR